MPDVGWRAFLVQSKRSFWLYFGGIWLLAGVILAVVGVGMALEERRWDDAVRTTGMVLTKDLIPADSDSSTQYRVTFRYANERGETVEGDQQVDVATWEGLSERGPIDVYHLPGSTEPARLEADPDRFGPVIFLVVGLVTAGVGGALFGRALRGVLRAGRLMATGVDATGTVTTVERTDVSFNRRPQFRVRYSYSDAGGATRAGDSGYLEWEEASTYGEGDTVAIRYDPARPAESLWLGRPGDSAGVVDAAPATPVSSSGSPGEPTGG